MTCSPLARANTLRRLEPVSSCATVRAIGGSASASAQTLGSEDMADMLAIIPGASFAVGQGGGEPLHNPGGVMDDAILPIGASIFARLVETRGNAAAG